MTWNMTETPYGTVAYSVNSDGSVYIVPAFGIREGYGGVMLAEETDTNGNPATLKINGVHYPRENFSIELDKHTKEPRVLFNYYHNAYTASAREKLRAWGEAHYGEMATPVRVAEAKVAATKSSYEYAAEEAQAAIQKRTLADHEWAMARQALDILNGYKP